MIPHYKEKLFSASNILLFVSEKESEGFYVFPIQFTKLVKETIFKAGSLCPEMSEFGGLRCPVLAGPGHVSIEDTAGG